ncbi:hypothetical protein BASA82_000581 [Batrachochytrium salamandrivorans]|nr:hypothetical protein BASA82_000581 [Batrachochytrium salamandrivorans]
MLPSILLAVVMGALPAMADINFDNLTCDVAEGRLCGAGTCLADFTCQCDAYYSTINDFVTIPGDCSTNVIGIYVLWALNAVVLCFPISKRLG